MDYYHLKSNGTRTVVGTDEDFLWLAQAPRPEGGYEDLIPPVKAPNWLVARDKLLAAYQQPGKPGGHTAPARHSR